MAARHGLDGWVVYPTNDEAAALLARHEAVLGKRFRLTTPAWAAMRWAYDKRLTYALAARLGIDHPWTVTLEDAASIATLDCTLPVILKPAVKDLDNRFTQARAWRVDDRPQLLARYAEACALVGPERVLIQELVQGGGDGQFSFVALCNRGEPVASAVARRLRQYPPDFGHGSSFVETLGEQPAIEAAARRLLAAIGYTGLVEIEFKRDSRSGRLQLLDVNARAWAWHTLGRRAGVDFAYLAWQLARGEAVLEARGLPGARWVRATTDLPAALTYIRRGGLSVGGYLRSLRPPLECAVFALDDPVPALFDIPALVYRACRRGLSQRRLP
jgi:D-aspartate ligase